VNRGVLRLIVENDVPGVPDASGTGTGLGATRDRLRLLYGTAGSLETTRLNGRFRVTVTLPAREADTSARETVVARAHR
jgi:LytS/YehU family sensor histidine kinase